MMVFFLSFLFLRIDFRISKVYFVFTKTKGMKTETDTNGHSQLLTDLGFTEVWLYNILWCLTHHVCHARQLS